MARSALRTPPDSERHWFRDIKKGVPCSFSELRRIFVELGVGFDSEHEDRVQEEAITQARAALGK